jgi:hypothetical protein
MKRDRKIHTQGTGKEENKVENIRPDQGASTGTDDMAHAGTTVQAAGEDINAGNQVTEDKVVGGTERQDDRDTFSNNNTTNNYAEEADVNTGGVALDKSPGATNKGNNPSNADLAASPADDSTSIARSVNEDAEKQTGRPTGAIYGSGGEIISVSNPAANKAATKKSAAAGSKKKATPKEALQSTRIFGQIQKEDNGFFIKQGNVPQGQLQLLGREDILARMADYQGQMVSMEGELSKKNKADTYATFSVHRIVSHEQIGHRAYELSQQNPASEEENWLRAENELLQA